MTEQRQPCPCDSGIEYKACCKLADTLREEGHLGTVRAIVRFPDLIAGKPAKTILFRDFQRWVGVDYTGEEPEDISNPEMPPDEFDALREKLLSQLTCEVLVDILVHSEIRSLIQTGVDFIEGKLDRIAYLTLKAPEALHYEEFSTRPGKITIGIEPPFNESMTRPRVKISTLPSYRRFDIVRFLVSNYDSNIMWSMKWLRKGMLASTPEEQYVFWWIALEMLCEIFVSGETILLKCDKGHTIKVCPTCDYPLARPAGAKTGLKKHVQNELKMPQNIVDDLWKMRNKLMHGKIKIDQNLRKEVKSLLPKLFFVLITAYNTTLDRPPHSHPILGDIRLEQRLGSFR